MCGNVNSFSFRAKYWFCLFRQGNWPTSIDGCHIRTQWDFNNGPLKVGHGFFSVAQPIQLQQVFVMVLIYGRLLETRVGIITMFLFSTLPPVSTRTERQIEICSKINFYWNFIYTASVTVKIAPGCLTAWPTRKQQGKTLSRPEIIWTGQFESHTSYMESLFAVLELHHTLGSLKNCLNF